MRDLWGFLLQTLTASGAAVLLLAVKAMFRDKLSPRWQLSAWVLLLAVLLIPAGAAGRYRLFNWPWAVETLKTFFTGDYSLTIISAPIPLPVPEPPETVEEWIYAVYVSGAVLLLLWYALSFLRLRLALRRGTTADQTTVDRISALAARYHLPVCRAVEVSGLQSAFVCGVFRPVLALPAGEFVDDKVLLHELLHLKHRDVLWGMGTCLFRCIHWCNPLLWYCADRIGNDVESACDQRVLECLEGEDRRAYGQILLSMANENYARAPGTSSMANGGKNIRRRIEAIARFKRYPAGMALVSVCVWIILAMPIMGSPARSVYTPEGRFPQQMDLDAAMASARTTWCTTPAGALDTYSKALITQNGIYRAMCAPLEQQETLAAGMKAVQRTGTPLLWDTGLPCGADEGFGYAIYNLEPIGGRSYECLVVTVLKDYPYRRDFEKNWHYIASQPVRVEQADGRWIVLPQGGFRVEEFLGDPWLTWGVESLPAYVYSDTADGFRAELHLQKVFTVDNTIEETNDLSWAFGPTTRFDAVPKPDAAFDTVHWNHFTRCVYAGNEADKATITSVGLTCAPLEEDGSRPELRPVVKNSSGSSSDGSEWGGQSLEENWDNEVAVGGGGTSSDFDKNSFGLPEGYAAQLYINWKPASELTLRLQEGGAV